jgi:hypothetical protein
VTLLRFQVDWDPADGSVRAPELRATWCRLTLRVGGDCVTLAEDRTTGSVRHGSSLSLYPLAEWIAFNWWPLCFDGRDDGAPQRFSRRNLRSSGDGFLWPDCEFVPQGDATLLRWTGDSPDSAAVIRYLGQGARTVASSEVHDALAGVVEAAIARLGEEGIGDTPLHKEWRALRSMDAEEEEFCRAAARLGLDPFTEGVDLAASISDAVAAVEPTLLDDFLDSAPPTELREAASWIEAALDRIVKQDDVDARFGLEQVEAAIQAAGSSDWRPWLAGYRAARALRELLQLEPTTPFPDQVPVSSFPTTRYRPFVAAGRRFGGDAAVGMASGSGTAKRFAVARSLWHAGLAPESSAFLLTTARSASQRAGRAFAAELLAPAEGIRELLGLDPSKAPPEEIERVADELKVASMVVKHQIDNQLQPAH